MMTISNQIHVVHLRGKDSYIVARIHVCLFVRRRPLNKKRLRPEIWYTHSSRGHLTALFEKVTLGEGGATLEKLLCHVHFRIYPQLPRF